VFVVDSNVLVYAANRNAPEFPVCHAALARWRTQMSRWYLTWSICFEFMRVATHRGTIDRPWSLMEAWDFICALRESPSLRILVPGDNFADAYAETIASARHLAGADVHDAHIVALMREHGVQNIYTRNMGFHRFPGLKVIDPIASEPQPPGLHE
jgi:toxin-antitoxin system PIN domain toxin